MFRGKNPPGINNESFREPRSEISGSEVPNYKRGLKREKGEKLEGFLREKKFSPKNSNEMEMEAQLDPCKQDFEDYSLEMGKRQQNSLAKKIVIPAPEPNALRRRELQSYLIQKIPYCTFVKLLPSLQYEIFVFRTDETATALVWEKKVMNPECFLHEPSVAQEALIAKHLTGYGKWCWILPNNFRCSLPRGIEFCDIPYPKATRREARFWILPFFDGRSRDLCTSLVMVPYKDWAHWEDSYGLNQSSSNKYSVSDPISESHVGERSYLSGTNLKSRLKVDYNKFRDENFFGTGNFNGQVLNVIFSRKISINNIHSHPTMIKHLNEAREAGQSFVVISNLPKGYCLQTSRKPPHKTTFEMDDHPEFLKLINSGDVAVAIIKKEIHYKRFQVRSGTERIDGPAKFDSVFIYVGFRREVFQVLGHGEVQWEDFSFLSRLEPLRRIIYPRSSRSKMLREHLRLELDLSKKVEQVLVPATPCDELLQVCETNAKFYRVHQTRLHKLKQQLMPSLRKLARDLKSFPRPRLVYSRGEYARLTTEEELRFEKLVRNLACSKCNRRGHANQSCWMIFRMPSDASPKLRRLVKAIDQFKVRKIPCFAKPGHIARLDEWGRFEEEFYKERVRFLKFAKSIFKVDPEDPSLHSLQFGFGQNKRNWIALLLLGAHKTLVKRTLVGFRPYWHYDEWGHPILPTPVIFVNRIETADDEKCFQETLKDCHDGKFIPVPFDPAHNSLIRGGAKVFRVHEVKADGKIKERPITAGMVQNAALYKVKKTLPNERKVGRFTVRGAHTMTCDAEACFEQIPIRSEYAVHFAHVYQCKNGKYEGFLPDGNPQGGRQSPTNASEVVCAITEGLSSGGIEGISYVDDVNLRLSDGIDNIDKERGPESVEEILEKGKRVRIFLEKNLMTMNPKKHTDPGLVFKMIGYLWQVNEGTRVPCAKRVAKFGEQLGRLVDMEKTDLGNLMTTTGIFVNIYAHEEMTKLLANALYKLISKVYREHGIPNSLKLRPRERKLLVTVPQSLKDSLVDFVLQHKMSCNYRQHEVGEVLNPISCPVDGKIVQEKNTAILASDAGRGALGCIAIICRDGKFNFVKKYPEVLSKEQREKHSTKREIMAGLHYLDSLKPSIIENDIKILNWLTDSTASTCIISGILPHEDPEVMTLVAELRAKCTDLGIKINVVWRRRNFPLLQYADLMTKLIPVQGDEVSPCFNYLRKKFLRWLSKRCPYRKRPLCKRMFSVLGSGKLLEAMDQKENVFVFPFSSNICEDIFQVMNTFPENKMLIIPVFPSTKYWKRLCSSGLSMVWIGLVSELFPSSPVRCKVAIWY